VQNTYSNQDTSNIIQFSWRLKKDGFAEKTIINYSKLLGLLEKLGANLSNPESVKSIISLQDNWSLSTKATVVAAYSKYASMNNLQWIRPKYKGTNKIPFIPLESEIDALIAYCGKKTSTILLLLKETAMRIGEALDLEWTDVNFESRTIVLNKPEKHSNARCFKISEKLCSMLLRLKKDEVLVFGRGSKHSVICNFRSQRKKAAIALANPRFRQIHFHTLRHWKATTEYHKTKDILHVMRLLGHKSINNTLIYTHLIDFEQSDEYTSATATTIEQAQKLIESGFDYVTEIGEVKLFRKRK
jgi:integrase